MPQVPGGGVDGLGRGGERDVVAVEEVDGGEQVGQPAGEPVDLVDEDGVELARRGVREQLEQLRTSLDVLRAGVLLVVAGELQGVLAGDVGVQLRLLELQGVRLVVLVGRCAAVGGDPDGPHRGPASLTRQVAVALRWCGGQ